MKTSLAVVSGWFGEVPEVVEDVSLNHKAFAHRHGYSHYFFGNRDISPPASLIDGSADYHWIKPQLLRTCLLDHEYVFWMDMDSVFFDLSESLEDLKRFRKNFVFTGDRFDVFNGGHLFLRRSDFSFELLEKWEELRTARFPILSTTQQGKEGYVGDQVAMNYLLSGGDPQQSRVAETGKELFNKINGWTGNEERLHKDFHLRYSPADSRNLRRTKSLVAKAFRKDVQIVPQYRLNSYPWWTNHAPATRKGPIVHFVPPYKAEMTEYVGKRVVDWTKELRLPRGR